MSTTRRTFEQAAAQDLLDEAIEEANDAFWAVIARRYPEVKTGDFGPEETHAFATACETAVRTWLRWNWPRRRYRVRWEKAFEAEDAIDASEQARAEMLHEPNSEHVFEVIEEERP